MRRIANILQRAKLHLYVSTHQPHLARVVRHLIQPNPLLGIKELAQNKKVLLSDKIGRGIGQLVCVLTSAARLYHNLLSRINRLRIPGFTVT